ncbi:MAG TPA: alpha-hydroxy acid oxidase [Iamia sp.]|nr:alpha-hydroxy acid oxidase [Iamia sp.]
MGSLVPPPHGPAGLWNVERVRQRAERRLPRSVFGFVDGGADDETTLRANRSAFAGQAFRPRVGIDVATRSLAVDVCGERLALPILTAPTGLAGLVHPRGELAAIEATEALGTRAVVSCGSSYDVEEIGAVATEGHWFQLYPWSDRAVVERLVGRAAAAGFRVLCVTLDVPVTGHRERDDASGMTIPPRLTAASAVDVVRHPRWAYGIARHRRVAMRNLADGTGADARRPLGLIERNLSLLDPSTSWADVASLRRLWDGPVVVKGILTGEDARRAEEIGADAVVVSNHGGRQLDGAPATLDVLPEVVAAVGERVEVLLDGGVRRGSDVVKALALGARACLVGRPWLYGAVDGTAGVAHVLELLRSEIDRTLALIGCPDVADLDPSYLR